MYAESAFRFCAARAATCAGPAPAPFKSHSAAGGSVGSTACTVSDSKAGCDSESGAVVRNRANSAIIVASEKSRVHTFRYARLPMETSVYRSSGALAKTCGSRTLHLWVSPRREGCHSEPARRRQANRGTLRLRTHLARRIYCLLLR